MSVSDADFLIWLAKDGVQRELLGELACYSGGATTRYVSRFGFTSRPTDTPANTDYPDLLLSLPQFVAKASELFTGRTTVSFGEPVISNENGDRDSWLNDAWDGRAAVWYLGDPSWPKSDFRRVIYGVTDDIVAQDSSKHGLRLRGREQLLNKPIQSTLIGGSDANANKPIPLCFGQCFNVEPVLVDASLKKYQVHAGAINAISDVRVNGVTVAYTADLATGTFVLTAAATGRVTADVQGAKPGGTYYTKTADLVSYIAQTYGGLSSGDIDASSISTINTAAPYTVGVYVRDRANTIDVIDQLVTGIGAAWSFTRDGALRVFRLESPSGTPTVSLVADDIAEAGIKVVRRVLPIKTVRVQYQRNWTLQPGGDLATSVVDGPRALYLATGQTKPATNTTTNYLMAPEPSERPSTIYGGTDAQTEATRLAALYAQLRFVYDLQCFVAPGRVNLGDVISLDHPRFGFSGGVLCVVVGITERPTDNRIQLEVFK